MPLKSISILHNNLQNNPSYCGYITILGRPNVGKSTLINHLIGQKISITSRKAHTTRSRLLGIKTEANHQMIYIDTPGLEATPRDMLAKRMNQEIKNAMAHIDLLIYMVEVLRWTTLDEKVLKLIKQQATAPVIVVVNKIDKIPNKSDMLDYLQQLSEKNNFAAIIPISALSDKSILPLKKCIKKMLPMQAFAYPGNQITDLSERYLVAECIREKLIKRLNAELPYNIAVIIESFTKQSSITVIKAIIWVTSRNQKTIVIGKKGINLKAVGQQARREIEHIIKHRVFLHLWVQVKEKWRNQRNGITIGLSH